jgi:hypothetical protein
MCCNLLCQVRERAEWIAIAGYKLGTPVYHGQRPEPVVLQLEDVVRIIEWQIPPLERHWLVGHPFRIAWDLK